ncbi:MAG: RNA methyltransferase [Candidatus Chromulinivorax sp.]|nr:RNA methyltransferase [Candidatus Chromulinivorax sp.]
MNYISSVSNEQVKHVVSLQDKWYRHEHGQFVVEGTRACSQLLEKYEPVVIYMTESYYADFSKVCLDATTGAAANKCIIQQYDHLITGVSQHVMDKMCTTKNPSGICAIFKIPTPLPLPQQGPGIVLIDVNDPGNLGTLIRTAAAMNIKEIILVGGVDPYNSKVIQSTAGCMTCVNIYQTTFEKLMEQTQLQLCALVVKHGTTPDKISLKNKFLVVGNEAHGLSPQHIQACQDKMTIPMPGHAESLNAAIAGAIGLYLMSLSNQR